MPAKTSQTTNPKPRRKPLTPEQRTQAFLLYTDPLHPKTMAYIADLLEASPSVVFRALHQEAHKRKVPLPVWR